MKKVLLACLTLSLIIVSCSKLEVVEPQKKNSPASNQGRLLTDSQIIEIANKHNLYLEEAFANFDYNASDYQVELQNQFQSVLSKHPEYNPYQNFIFNPNCDLNCIQNTLADNQASVFLNQLDNLDPDDYSDVTALKQVVNMIQNDARNVLQGPSLDAVLLIAEVYKASGDFWLPISKGGTGIGEQILIQIQNSTSSRPPGKVILAADAMGAGGQLIGGALIAGTAGGPIGVGVFFGAVAFSAAWSSGVAALL